MSKSWFILLLGIFSSGYVRANNLAPVPRVHISGYGSTIKPGSVIFYGYESFDPDGGYIINFSWYVDGVLKSNGPNSETFTHTFSLNEGEVSRTVSIKLIVKDDEQTTASITKTYTITALGRTEYYITDHLGNIRTTIDGATGAVLGYDDYYPFGLAMPGRSSNTGTPNDLNKFTGHERDTEGNLNLDYMLARNYDPELGRFLSVDPLASKMPAWSPYSFVFNNPLMFIDPDGRIPYPITIRSFAPFKTFGGGFHGDNRGFTTSSSASARVHQRINFDTDKTTIKTNAWSSPTWHKWNPSYKKTATPSVEFTKDFTIAKSGDSKIFNFGTHYAGANPLTPGAPNIDVFSDFSITENKKAGTLDINGKLTGDNFPSTEAFITDPAGNNVFIGVGFYVGSPFSSLWGENENNAITDFSFSITTDGDGNFTGVKVGDTNYSLSDWNKLFENADPHKNADQ